MLEQIDGIQSNDPQGAFYFFPNVSGLFGRSNGHRTINNADDLVDILLTEAHVGTVTGLAFGDPNSIRLSYATSNEKLTEALTRIKTTLEKYK
jgi:aspartate aminotransferase